MYKVYTTNYKPYWINSENKPSYDYFSQINFNWTLINGGVNYDSEQLISITVPNLDHIYFKIEEVDKKDVVKSVKYFYFDSVFRRLDNGFVVRCELDIWASYNINIEKHFIDNNSFVKFRRGSINLNNFIQYPVYVDSLLNSINDWKSKNNPIFSYWNEKILKPGLFYEYKTDNQSILGKYQTLDSKLLVDFARFYQKNYVFNKYFVVDYEGEYWLFPDFSCSENNTPQDTLNEINKPGISDNYVFYNTINNQGVKYQGDKSELNLMRLTAKYVNNSSITNNLVVCKLNTKNDMDYLINKSKFAAKKNVGYYYGPDLFDLLDSVKFNLDWGIWAEESTNANLGRCFFFVKLPFEGKKVNNLFDNRNNGNTTITSNLNTNTYLTNGERDIVIGNSILKYKQLINNNYTLKFDNSGFKLFPNNQTNIELFNVIEYGDILPTNKDLYLEYVASVRNSVNTGYWTNYAQKQFQLGQKAASGLFNGIVNQNTNSLASTAFNTVSNAISLEFQNSLLIANTKAKYADMKNSLSIKPQTTNVEIQNFYLIPQNWLVNNLNNLTTGNVVSYSYSIMDWLETTIVDINNLFLYYGFEINSTYNYNKIAENENFYYVQIDSEYLSREVNNLYPLNLDFGVKLGCMNEWTAGIRIFKKDYIESNIKWTVKK